MQTISHQFQIETSGPGLYEFTMAVTRFTAESGIGEGLLTIYIPHTSASLTIQENADPDVCHDLENFFSRLVSRDLSLYRHGAEGPDDMPAHIRAALTSVSLSVPVLGGRPAFGTWQGVYLFEHRDQPHQRTIHLQLVGS